MKLTHDERRALAFIAAVLCLSAAVRLAGLPDPVAVPGEGGFDLAAHIREVEAAVTAAEAAERPLEPGEKVDPNSATAAELDRLPRVGPSLARRIVEDREASGPFHALEDLGRVAGVGDRTLELLAPYLTLRPSLAPRPVAGGASPRSPTSPRRAGDPGRDGAGGPDAGATGGPGRRPPLDLNAADVTALAGLPGIGPVLAARIVAYRDSAGPFREIGELERVKGIGPATLARIRERVAVR